MDELILLGMLISLAILAGSICGFIALGNTSSLRTEINNLKEQLVQLQQKISATSEFKSDSVADFKTEAVEPSTPEPIANQQRQEADTEPEFIAPPTIPEESEEVYNTLEQSEVTSPAYSEADYENSSSSFIDKIKNNIMLWTGGVALAFGGVFFVNYSLEAGLLSPITRLIIGALFGISLIAVAEYLHWKKIPFEGFGNYIPAALAGGGFISLFALTLLALINFNLISPAIAFVFLAIIAFTASWYALRFGPILATLGILGAYSVPLWISSGQAQWSLLLSYIAIVTLSATQVAIKVKRSWLWYIIWLAHAGWLFITVVSQTTSANNSIAIAMFSAFSLLAIIMLPRLGIKFEAISQLPLETIELLKQLPDNVLVLVFTAAMGLFIWRYTGYFYPPIFIALFALPLLLAPLKFSGWDLWPFCIYLLLSLLLINMDIPVAIQDDFMAFHGQAGTALGFGLILFIYGLYFGNKYPDRLVFSVLAAGSFFFIIAFTYANLSVAVTDIMYPAWLVILLVSAIILVYFAARSNLLLQQFCYWCGINANISLGLTLLLDKTSLTLALAIQVLLMSRLICRHSIAVPYWPIKLLVAGIMLRMTIAPWQIEYSVLEFWGVHWSTIFYPVVIAIFAIANSFWQQEQAMRGWMQAALLHLVALFVTTQTSLYLVGHIPDFTNLGIYEQVVLSMNWLLLSYAYLYRQQVAGSLAPIYRYAASILLVIGGLLQLNLLVQYNPFLQQISVGSSIFLSWLWLWWAIPGLIGFLIYRKVDLINNNLKIPIMIAASVLPFLLVNGLIRQFWQGEYIYISQHTSDAEVYSYSIVWLLLGSILVSISHIKQVDFLQKAGFILLGAVVVKVFLIDMENLEGLLRAVSFIGLGLCLVALSWLFQWLRKQSVSG